MRPVLWSTSYLLRCPFGISMVTSKSTAAPWVTCSVTAPEDTSLAREPVDSERPWRRRPGTREARAAGPTGGVGAARLAGPVDVVLDPAALGRGPANRGCAAGCR